MSSIRKYIKTPLSITLFFIIIPLFLFFKQPYHYQNLNSDLIGSDISEIDEKIGVKRVLYIEVKEFIGYPYKKYKNGCGTGYSLIMYAVEGKVVQIKNKLSFDCNDVELLSKTQIINNYKKFSEYIFIYPFLNFEL